MATNKPDQRDPYTRLKKWEDGTLAFWRNNNLYSQKWKDYFEERLAIWRKQEKNMAKLNTFE